MIKSVSTTENDGDLLEASLMYEITNTLKKGKKNGNQGGYQKYYFVGYY